MEHSPLASRSRGIALAAVLSAVFVAYALVSSYIFGTVTHGTDTFIIRSLIFVILVCLISGFGYSTMMGSLTGLVLEFTVPSPVRFYLFPSLLAYGLIFDITTHIPISTKNTLSTTQLLLGTIFASIGMSATALAIFTVIGFFPPNLLLLVWGLGIARDVILGIIGATIGLVVLQRLTYLNPT